MPPAKEVPNYPLLFKHMVLAIYKSGRLIGPPKQKMEDSIKIAMSQLKEYGYILEVSTEARILLTSKGVQKNATHLKEHDKNAKTRLFDSLYTQLVANDKTTPTAKPGGIPASTKIDGKPFKKL